MRNKFTGILLLFVLAFAPIAKAQDIELKITQRGNRDFLIDAKATQASVLNIASALATEINYELKISSPEVTKILSENVIDVDLKGADLAEFIQLLGMSSGLRFVAKNRVEANEETGTEAQPSHINIDELPTPEEEGAEEYFRTQSLDAVVNAYAGDASSENEVEFWLRTARLHEIGGDMSQAYSAYEKFVQDYPTHPRFAEASLKAAEAAIKSTPPLFDKALTRVDQFLKDAPKHQDTGKALILGAQARLKKNDLLGAMRLYQTVIRMSLDKEIPERDGLVAEYYVAELHHRNGDDKAAIKLLEEIEWRHDANHNRDLLDQVWLYLGLCRESQGNRRDAIHDLNLAVHVNVAPDVRLRILLLLAEMHLEVDNPFFALNAVRAAKKLGAKGPKLFKTMILEGKAYRALLLHDEAQKLLLKAITDSPALISDENERLRENTAAMKEVAEDFFEDMNYGDALRALQTVHDAVVQHNLTAREDFTAEFGDEFVAEIKYMIAQCHAKLNDPKAALKTLDGISSGVGSEQLVKDIRQLKGDSFMALKMYERAIQTWSEGDQQ